MADFVYWTGEVPDRCQVTDTAINDVFYDAKIPGGGWAILSHAGYVRFGCRTGTGFGQKYIKRDDGRWLKVEG